MNQKDDQLLVESVLLHVNVFEGLIKVFEKLNPFFYSAYLLFKSWSL